MYYSAIKNDSANFYASLMLMLKYSLHGIEKIKDDGTVVFLDENVEYMKQVVGYNCKELKLEETEERAKELNTGLKRLYEKYRVS